MVDDIHQSDLRQFEFPLLPCWSIGTANDFDVVVDAICRVCFDRVLFRFESRKTCRLVLEEV